MLPNATILALDGKLKELEIMALDRDRQLLEKDSTIASLNGALERLQLGSKLPVVRSERPRLIVLVNEMIAASKSQHRNDTQVMLDLAEELRRGNEERRNRE